MEVLRGIVGILLLFSVAIFVHEFGHFFFAKLFGVGVETFSIGFGPKVWRRRWKGTEYCLSAIPFGGYVKLSGVFSRELAELLEEEKPKDRKAESLGESVYDEIQALRSRPYWQKILIFSAGCINNLLTAMLVYFLMAWIGFMAPEPMPPVIEKIDPSVASLVPLQPMDRVVRVGEDEAKTYAEFLDGFVKYAGEYRARAVPLEVVRDATTIPLMLNAWLIPDFSPDEDQLVEVNGKKVSGPRAAAEIAARTLGKQEKIPVVIARRENRRELEVPVPAAAAYHWPELALEPRSLPYIGMVLPNLPAERAGLQTGDMILAVKGQRVETRVQATEIIRKSIGEEIEIVVERRGKDGSTQQLTFKVPVRPDPEIPQRGQIGIVFSQPFTHHFQLPLDRAAAYALTSTVALAVGYLKTVGTLLQSSFQTVRENVGGPVAISRFTYDAAKRGWKWFFDFFAMFNIILAVTNLFPLPVLDGGHILIATIEAIIRRPIPAHLLLKIYNVFIVLLISLAILITFNDIIMNAWRLL